MLHPRLRALMFLGVVAALLGDAAPAHAYIGPGAGVAVAASGVAIIVSLVLAIVGLLLWPLRLLWRLATRKPIPNPPRVRRAVVVGLDGLDPELTRRFMAEGKLPNLSRLAGAGMFSELATTLPAMSPVAWSSFATGVRPGKHGIYDFITRDPHSYRADLSSTEIEPARRTLRLGKYRIPIGRARFKLLRKSKSFWQVLGRYRVPCSILRVPITFPPPEKFAGTLLSAMCVPDLRGTQGSFTYYSSADEDRAAIGGDRVAVELRKGRVDTWLEGPPNPMRSDGRRVRLRLRVDVHGAGGATLRVGRRRLELAVDVDSEWVQVAFPLAFGLKLPGICRFRLLEAGARLRLYVSPINIDPERPIMPISHPRIFATFLAKLNGTYATLGLAEDTWALNEGVLDEDAFLDQAWSNHAEREAMFFAMLRRTRRGLTTCVFDGTDRIQHMFMRFLDDDHPAAGAADSPYRAVIEDTYRRMDEMVGRVMGEVDISDRDNFVAVISDHGFKSFRRGVNLNSWLRERGYLVLSGDLDRSGEWFDGVDWSKTRAFALGLGGIFINVAGRERHGIVAAEEASALATRIAGELTGLEDGAAGGVAIRRAYPAHQVYAGPYVDEAPDIIVGYAAGWRAAWDGARGIVGTTVFADNTRPWSGDHCIDPELVPGVLICNHDLGDGEHDPEICDLAPTILTMFGIDAPGYMDGRSLCTDP